MNKSQRLAIQLNREPVNLFTQTLTYDHGYDDDEHEPSYVEDDSSFAAYLVHPF